MRAVRLEALNSVRVCELSTPEPGPRHLLLRIDACGICGTDRHILHGEYPATLPVTLGHEFSGTVVQAGAETGIPVGTRVAVDPNISCGTCRDCRRGRVAYCSGLTALGVNIDGGLATHALVPATQAYQLPPALPAEHGALCEPLACAIRGLDRADIRPGMSVAVIGGGVIGQLMVQLARLAGATTVVMATLFEHGRSLAESLGATATVDPRAVDPIQAITGNAGTAPGGVDVVIECVGSVGTFQQALGLAARGGTVLVFGVTSQGLKATISPYDVFARELRIVGSYLNPLTHGRAVELAASGRLNLDALITRRLSLEEVAGTIAAEPRPSDVKAMLVA